MKGPIKPPFYMPFYTPFAPFPPWSGAFFCPRVQASLLKGGTEGGGKSR